MAIAQIDYENADRDITNLIIVLTHTPSTVHATFCQGYIQFGDGVKALDGSGGNFEFIILIGGQTIQPSPQIVNLGTEVKSSVWTIRFPVPMSQEVVFKVKSPNVADNDVDISAYLYEIAGPLFAVYEFIAEHISDYFIAECIINHFIAEPVRY